MDKEPQQTTEDDAQTFLDFYADAMDNHRSSFKYHLSETAVLDWFGKTVKGCKNIATFLSTIACTHHFTNAKAAEKIGFRDTHTINHQNNHKETKVPERPATNLGEHTPPNPTTSTTPNNRILEQGQGDGLHNCASPVKKSRVANVAAAPMKFLVAEGRLEFLGGSGKKLMRATRWSRPCKLHVAYTRTGFDDGTVYLMIYEGSVKCRRNLMKDFEAAGAASTD